MWLLGWCCPVLGLCVGVRACLLPAGTPIEGDAEVDRACVAGGRGQAGKGLGSRWLGVYPR